MSIDDLLVVLQAAKEGKILQRLEEGEWKDHRQFTYPLVHGEWRVKPEPREWWLCGTNHWETREMALEWTKNPIHVREVLE